jgi:integrase/recombinase XerC
MDGQLRAPVLLTEAETLGVTIDNLVAAAREASVRSRAPTVADYLETIAPTMAPATVATYRSYWRLAVSRFGDRQLASVTVDDCEAVVTDAMTRARQRRPNSDGRASRESCIAALRALFGRAQRAGLVHCSPADALHRPHRAASRRRALDQRELRELIDAVRTTSDDPGLDLLLVRFHLESGARRQGALGLRLRDLDHRRSTAWLREKFDLEREQPISPSLLALVAAHAISRGARSGDDRIFRSAGQQPLTRRHYDTLFVRARRCLPWTDRTPVSAHVLRHTAISAVGRIAGYAVAQAFAGHRPSSATGIYLHASPAEVAAAVAALTGEPHPLADAR